LTSLGRAPFRQLAGDGKFDISTAGRHFYFRRRDDANCGMEKDNR
jgi:hypothetical protein